MWINNILVGFVDDFLVAATEKGGIWMRIGNAMVAFIDRHMFGSDMDGEESEQEMESDIVAEESLAGGI